MHERMRNYFYIALFAIGSVGFLFSADYVFNNVLEPHQQIRIKVVLGMEEDLAGAGYNEMCIRDRYFFDSCCC